MRGKSGARASKDRAENEHGRVDFDQAFGISGSMRSKEPILMEGINGKDLERARLSD